MSDQESNTDEKFEESMELLRSLVQELQSSQLSLADNMQKYKQGMQLIEKLRTKLTAAEQQLIELEARTATDEQ